MTKRLATLPIPQMKSRRTLAPAAQLRWVDEAFLLAEGVGPAMGATTVAATMIVAALAGIRVFATGGIGDDNDWTLTIVRTELGGAPG